MALGGPNDVNEVEDLGICWVFGISTTFYGMAELYLADVLADLMW